MNDRVYQFCNKKEKTPTQEKKDSLFMSKPKLPFLNTDNQKFICHSLLYLITFYASRMGKRSTHHKPFMWSYLKRNYYQVRVSFDKSKKIFLNAMSLFCQFC